eukprot:TRINITY_DN13370_c0_g1_i1.p1 TRINITY_DN13370_c0_g1~~TRINITY_DN13370_c0_g1_i1.p1  ORF type:complete len:129 (+),score=45.42 TRINITY_DN13370_c0_g1_i1:63-449(+)
MEDYESNQEWFEEMIDQFDKVRGSDWQGWNATPTTATTPTPTPSPSTSQSSPSTAMASSPSPSSTSSGQSFEYDPSELFPQNLHRFLSLHMHPVVAAQVAKKILDDANQSVNALSLDDVERVAEEWVK